jgi:hypothetical protein
LWRRFNRPLANLLLIGFPELEFVYKPLFIFFALRLTQRFRRSRWRCQILLTGTGWNHITTHACQDLIIKFKNHAPLLDDLAFLTHLVEIIPAVTVKTVLNQWRAHNKTHLGFGHPRTQLHHHFGRYNIALLDIHPIGLQ